MLKPVDTYLGLDYGTKKIGVAKANSLTKTATELQTIHYQNEQTKWQTLQNLIAQWQPKLLILGIPVHMDEKKQPITELALDFSTLLQSKFNLPVIHVDERLTSIEAKAIFKQQRQSGKKKKTKKGDIDKIAACLILQQWLNEQPYE